jgi:GntR family transcriptional regulator/MocR family aminotransferase
LSETLIYLDPASRLGLQSQIRQKLVDGILTGTFPTGGRLPSSRKLAEQLGVARNTVVLAYEQLIEKGFLESRERSGIFVNKHALDGRVGFHAHPVAEPKADTKWREAGPCTGPE